jgi:hypothetical protein
MVETNAATTMVEETKGATQEVLYMHLIISALNG